MTRRVYTLIGMSFLFSGGFTSVSPVLPDVVSTFGVSVTQAGLLLSAFAAGRMAFGVIGGMIADRFTLGPVVMCSCAVVLTSSICAMITDSFTVLIAARVLQGVGTAVYMVAATGYMIDVLPADQLLRALAWNQSFMLAGMSVGPTLGGLASVAAGYRGPFILLAVYGALGMITSTTLLHGFTRRSAGGRKEDDCAESRTETRGGDIWKTLLTPILLTVLGVSMVVAALRAGIRSTIAPLYAADLLGFDAVQNGVLLTVAGFANIAMMWPIARSIEIAGWRRVMAISTPLSAIPLAGFVFVTDEWHMYVILSVLAMVSGFSGVVTGSAIAELAPRGIRKTLVGTERTVRDFAFMASPVVVTAGAGTFGYPALFWSSAVVVLVVGAVTAVVVYRSEPPGPGGSPERGGS